MYVLICGKSGSGKSTIGNAILGSPDQFIVSRGLEQATTVCEQRTKGDLNIVELVGTGETNMGKVPHKEALRINRDYLRSHRGIKYDVVLFVMRSGRFDQADFESIKDFLRMLSFTRFSRCVIVFVGESGWLERNKNNIHALYPETATIEMTEVDLVFDRDVSMENLHHALRPISMNNVPGLETSSPAPARVIRLLNRRKYAIVSLLLTVLVVIVIAIVLSRPHITAPVPLPVLPPAPAPLPVLPPGPLPVLPPTPGR